MAHWHVIKVSQGCSDDFAAKGRLVAQPCEKTGESNANGSIPVAMDGWVHTHLLRRFDIAGERFEVAAEGNPSD